MVRSLAALGFAAAGGVLFAAGCADNDSTLFVMDVLAAVPPACTLTPDPTSLFLPSGTLDIALRTHYDAALLVGNQYTPRGTKDQLRTETARISLQGAEIQLTDSLGKSLARKFSVAGSGFAHPNKGEDPGYGIFAAEMIPSSVGEGLAADIGTDRSKTSEVIIHVRVYGKTTGGQDVESGEFIFPVHVCYGCLVQYPLKALDANGQCRASADDAPQEPCRLGQDENVDCRLCATRLQVCSAP